MREEESFSAFSNGTIQMAAIRDTGKNHGMISKRVFRVRDQKGREAGAVLRTERSEPLAGPDDAKRRNAQMKRCYICILNFELTIKNPQKIKRRKILQLKGREPSLLYSKTGTM